MMACTTALHSGAAQAHGDGADVMVVDVGSGPQYPDRGLGKLQHHARASAQKCAHLLGISRQLAAPGV